MAQSNKENIFVKTILLSSGPLWYPVLLPPSNMSLFEVMGISCPIPRLLPCPSCWGALVIDWIHEYLLVFRNTSFLVLVELGSKLNVWIENSLACPNFKNQALILLFCCFLNFYEQFFRHAGSGHWSRYV